MWIRLPEVHPIPRQRGHLDPRTLVDSALVSPIRSQVCTKKDSEKNYFDLNFRTRYIM